MDNYLYDKCTNEKLFYKTLPSGLKCYIIPKHGFREKQAAVCVRYGAVDNIFSLNGQKHELPAGVAHFLEHKLFEDEKVNISEEFAKKGVMNNAYTNATTTAYYFNGADNFYDCLDLLLDMTEKPYFTDENVENEKRIIEQEIEMYTDDPGWRVYYQALRGGYDKHPICEYIAGDAETIRRIDKDMLYNCYDAFYKPDNMAVVCVGDDIDPEKVFKAAGKRFCGRGDFSTERIYKAQETAEKTVNIENNRIITKMNLSAPRFCIVFKAADRGQKRRKTPEDIAAAKILLDVFAGESSSFYSEMYADGIIDNGFSFDYIYGPEYAHAVFAGESAKCEKVYEKILDRAEYLIKNGIDKNDIERIKKKHIGRIIRGFNYIDATANGAIDCFARGFGLFDMSAAYNNVTEEVVNKSLLALFRAKESLLSVVH